MLSTSVSVRTSIVIATSSVRLGYLGQCRGKVERGRREGARHLPDEIMRRDVRATRGSMGDCMHLHACASLFCTRARTVYILYTVRYLECPFCGVRRVLVCAGTVAIYQAYVYTLGSELYHTPLKEGAWITPGR